KPVGKAPNVTGFGAKISVYYGGGQQQFYEHSVYRGYLSSVEAIAHFGLGVHEKADSVFITWPDGSQQLLRDVQANQVLQVKQGDALKATAVLTSNKTGAGASKPLFQEVSSAYGVQFLHEEDDKIDFNIQRTLPHKYSQNGPGLAVGDVDGNGLDDFYVGGSAGRRGALFLQQADGRFMADTGNKDLMKEKPEEDMGSLFFDADGDGDLDLYIVSGSYEYEPNAQHYQDRLYRNGGQGRFVLDTAALPPLTSSGAAVKAADFDGDGDLDLFVGGRVVPGSYPLAPQSYLLRNDAGHFTDVTAAVAPELVNFGMISDALWTDFDQDGKVDLVVAGEWMPLSFFKNTQGSFKNVSAATGVSHLMGWWNSVVAGDFDGDGDMDYVAGNLGLNTHYKANAQQPLRVYAKDFDDNGRLDAVLSCYIKAEDGQMKPFPMHTRDDLIIQMLRTRRQFQRYEQYGEATIDQVLSPEDQKDALILEANHFASTYFENQGNGTFTATALPMQAQVAPIFGMLSGDYDGDGKLDLLLVGNSYATEVFTGRYDASIGLLLKGDGQGGLHPEVVAKSGFFVDGDAKGFVSLYGKDEQELLLVSQNQDSLRMFSRYHTDQAAEKGHLLLLEPLDAWAQVQYQDGRMERREFYYGTTYLSQSSRKLTISADARAVTFFDYQGNSRKVRLPRPSAEIVAER
ncbi:MAG: VCBS repeat-containing protein, partial [Bacteroidetes bacterium]|nr:VCBS repeat-containing protein [Bacteroidota bacterium]